MPEDKGVTEPERPLEPQEEPRRHCPVCGAEEPAYEVYRYGEAMGCEECLTIMRRGVMQ